MGELKVLKPVVREMSILDERTSAFGEPFAFLYSRYSNTYIPLDWQQCHFFEFS